MCEFAISMVTKARELDSNIAAIFSMVGFWLAMDMTTFFESAMIFTGRVVFLFKSESSSCVWYLWLSPWQASSSFSRLVLNMTVFLYGFK